IRRGAAESRSAAGPWQPSRHDTCNPLPDRSWALADVPRFVRRDDGAVSLRQLRALRVRLAATEPRADAGDGRNRASHGGPRGTRRAVSDPPVAAVAGATESGSMQFGALG